MVPEDESIEHRLFGASPLGVFRTDEQGRCVYTNAAWQAIYGLSLAESLGDGWAGGLHPDDRAGVATQWLADAQAGRPFDRMFRVRRRDGSVRHVRSRAWAVPGGFVGAVEDITEVDQQARELRGALQLLDRTGQVAGVGGWEIDLRKRRVRWSAQTYRLHDRPLDWQPTIEDGITYYAPEARPVIADLVDRAIRFGEPFDVELPFTTAAGRQLMVRAVGDVEFEDGVAVRVFGAFQDMTARRAADEEIRRSREQLRYLYDETPALMASIDAEGLVVSVSSLLLERLGLQRQAVVGRPAALLLAGGADDRACATKRVTDRLRDRGGIRALPLSLVRADGDVVHTLMSAVIERNAAGRLQRLLAVFEDVTESMRRQAELDRERALREEVERQAVELLRLADERREMLDVLAHEVRQPLNNASAALQSAASTGWVHRDGEALDRLGRAQGVIGDVVAQIDNTLAAAALLVGGRSLERTDTDIDTLLQLVVADFAPAERLRIDFDRATPTRTASMDLSLVRLALRNLLANALRHAPPRTRVTVRVDDSDAPLALLVDVIDRGPGVPEPLRADLFERGTKGPGSRGQGLGLHIARRALELHGGTALLLRSRPGETVFRLVLAQGDPGDSAYSVSGALNT